MSSSRILSVSLAALLLVGGVNVASYAVNGHPLLLGRSNGETRTTILRNTGPGPALELRTRPGAPPLTVSSSRRVAGLNADLVDGIEGDDLSFIPLTPQQVRQRHHRDPVTRLGRGSQSSGG